MYSIEKPYSEYKRQGYDFKEDYIRIQSLALSTMKNISIEEARAFIEKKIENIKVPDVVFEKTLVNQDRIKQKQDIFSYMKEAAADDNIMSGTLTQYGRTVPPEAKIVDKNMKLRGVYKNKAFECEADGDEIGFNYNNVSQVGTKTISNSLSGLFDVKGSITYSPSCHSTLTSTARLATSISTIHQERLLKGNRLYRKPQDAISDLFSKLVYVRKNREAIDKVFDKYQLNNTTKEIYMDMVRTSASSYYINESSMQELESVLNTLDPREYSACLYLGDIYSLSKTNEDFVREMFDTLSKANQAAPEEGYLDRLSEVPEDVLNAVHHILHTRLVGKGSIYKKIDEETCLWVLGTARTLMKTYENYGEYLSMFVGTEELAPNIPYFKTMIRDVVIGNDTDSSIYSVDHWAQWMVPNGTFDQQCPTIGVVGFIVGQMTDHLTVYLSKNMGIDDENLGRIRMKSELTIPNMAMTTRSKHYVADIQIQERNVMKAVKYERKGVGFRNANVPLMVKKKSHAMQEHMFAASRENRGISLHYYLHWVYLEEQRVIADIKGGQSSYFQGLRIKNLEDYTTPEYSCNYKWISFWNDVFAPKYGNHVTTPTHTVRVHVQLKNKTLIKEWLDKMTDSGMKERIVTWLGKTRSGTLEVVSLPTQYLHSNDMPEEILAAMDIRRIVTNSLSMLYLTLETLNYYVPPHTILSDHFTEESLIDNLRRDGFDKEAISMVGK